MVSSIDGIAAIQAPMRIQEQLHSPQRQSQIPMESQERDAVKKQAELIEQVQRDEEALAKTIRDDDPQHKRKQQQNQDEAEEEEETLNGQPHVDLLA